MPVDQETLNEEAAVQRSFLDARVFVVGGGFQYIQMFHEAGFRGARTVEDADIVCFTGGEDVSPSFYGEEAIPGVYSNVQRDEYEAGVDGEALALKKAMVGKDRVEEDSEERRCIGMDITRTTEITLTST